jgi:hypothetical protein
LYTTFSSTQASLCDLLNLSAQAFSFVTSSGWLPAPRPMNHTTFVAVGAQPSPVVLTGGGMVGVGTGVGAAAALVGVGATGAVVGVAAAAGAAERLRDGDFSVLSARVPLADWLR